MVKLLRVMFAVIVVLLITSQLFAAETQSDRERKVKIALAMTEQCEGERCPKRAAKIEAVLASERETKVSRALCGCFDTGECQCKAGKCQCCTNDLPAVADVTAKAIAAKKPLLVYYGDTKGHCIDGAIAARSKAIPAGLDTSKPIVVYAPHANGYKPIQQFDVKATNAEISVAIREGAKAMREGESTSMPVPVQFCPNGQCQPTTTYRRR